MRCLTAAAALLLAAAPLAQERPPPPAGASPQVMQGAQLYQQHCALCHGPRGREGVGFPRPIWGAGADIARFVNDKGLFEYLQLQMPFDDPNKIDDAGKTAVLAYMLVRNGSLPPAQALPVGGSGTPIGK